MGQIGGLVACRRTLQARPCLSARYPHETPKINDERWRKT